MAGYIGSKASVTVTSPETDSRYVNVTGDTMTGALAGTDLTLSGGVYLGGTGSANYLDDYEEGTWTPTFVNAYLEGAYASATGFTGVAGKYIKVGNKVTCWAEIREVTGASGNLVGDDNFTFAGLPFVASQPSGWTVWDVLAGTVSIYQAVGLGVNASGPIIAVTGGNVVAQVTAIANSVSSTSSYVMLNFTYIAE